MFVNKSVFTNSNVNFTKIMGPDACKMLTKENLLMNQHQANSYTQNRSSSPRPVNLKGYVGFDKLANQYVDKCIKEGFSFNILCIGETGIGKSTLIDTLFNANFNLRPSAHTNSKVKLNSNTFELNENNINLKLTIIETSGYGDQINKDNSHEEIVNYLNQQYEAYLQEELSLKRNILKQINDTRVHACLYFLTPTGHSLKALDLNTMKALDRKVNIIPIIAKADTICKNELLEFKQRIMNELSANNVSIYQFPINEYDLNVNNLNATVNGLFPLAIVGSSEYVKVGNKLTRGRQYEWGVVSVENESHCDFVKLREMILSTNMVDLIELTHLKHYSMYRANRLKEIGFSEDIGDDGESNGAHDSDLILRSTSSNKLRTIQDVYNTKRTELNEEIQRKKLEIEEEFIKKVKSKECELREWEKDLNNRCTFFKREQNEWTERIESKRRELEEQMREFSERKFTLEKSKLSTLSSMCKNSKKK